MPKYIGNEGAWKQRLAALTPTPGIADSLVAASRGLQGRHLEVGASGKYPQGYLGAAAFKMFKRYFFNN